MTTQRNAIMLFSMNFNGILTLHAKRVISTQNLHTRSKTFQMKTDASTGWCSRQSAVFTDNVDLYGFFSWAPSIIPKLSFLYIIYGAHCNQHFKCRTHLHRSEDFLSPSNLHISWYQVQAKCCVKSKILCLKIFVGYLWFQICLPLTR